MATLLCGPGLPRPGTPEWAGIEGLRAAGEALALLAPGDCTPAQPVTSPAAMAAAFDDQQLAQIAAELPPAWLDGDDFNRVLLVSAAASREALSAAEQALVEALMARGFESIELTPPEALVELEQSWYSGRRVGISLR